MFTGERITNMHVVFTWREGINLISDFKITG